MADDPNCDTWKRELAEKRSYLDTWRRNETDAQNEYGSALEQKWKADQNLVEAQNEVNRAQHQLDYTHSKKVEAEGKAADLWKAYQELEWKIGNNCSGY